MNIKDLEFKVECSVPLDVFRNGDIEALVDLILAAGFKRYEENGENVLLGEFISIADNYLDIITYTQTYTYQQWLNVQPTIH